MSLRSRAISGNNQFSEPIRIGDRRAVHFSVVNAFVGTIELQIRFNFSKDDDWRTELSVTDEEIEDDSYVAPSNCELRVGSTAYTSGSPVVEARIARAREGGTFRLRRSSPIITPTIGPPYDLSAGIPAGLSAHDGWNSEVVGGYLEDLIFTKSGASNSGLWEDQDLFDGSADDFDIRLTFVWNPAATSSGSLQFGPAVYDTDIDAVEPAAIGVLSSRNAPGNFLPARESAAGNSFFGAMVGSASSIAYAGGELTADGTTEHTMGFAMRGGTEMTSFFDGVQKQQFTMNAAAQTKLDGCVRIGIAYPTSLSVDNVNRLRLLEFTAAGVIYSPT